MNVQRFRFSRNYVPVAAAQAACAGDVEALALHLEDDMLDHTTVFQSTCLHLASKEGQVEVVKWLLQKGADINILDYGGMRRTALHYACQEGHIQVVEVLVDAGADINIWCEPIDRLQQAQGKGWSQLVQGSKCGALIDTSSGPEMSPATLCTNNAVRLALQRPEWDEERHHLFPEQFKAVIRLLLLSQYARRPCSEAETATDRGSTGMSDVPHQLMREVFRSVAYPISQWVPEKRAVSF